MKHSYTKIPEQEPAILANTSKAIVSVIATPWIKAHRRHPRLMTLTPGNDCGLRDRPDGHQVILAAGEDIFAVW
jgi:hypothetical protein